MTFTVDEFRSALQFDGARPNLFQVIMPFPTGVGIPTTSTAELSFMCRAAEVPASTVGIVNMMYWGREVKLAGNRTFAPWTVTIINDEDFQLRNAFELWLNGINSHQGNLRTPTFASPIGYTVNATVNHYGKTGGIIQTYNMIGAFPNEVANIALEWSSNDNVEEFNVTLDYQYWQSTAITT